MSTEQQIDFEVKSNSNDGTYTVSFIKDQDKLSVHCTCKAGMMGNECSHRRNLLSGDTSSVVGGDTDELTTAFSWIPGTEIEAALSGYDQTLIELEQKQKKANMDHKKTKNEITAARRAAKKKLGRIMDGK